MEKAGGHNVEWKTMKLGDICEPSSEKYNPLTESLFQDCIEMENINQESGTINGKSDITKLLSLKTKFHKGEVLYGKLRPYLRKYWLADFDGACSTEIWVLKSDENIDNRFLFYLFQSEFINKIANLSSGTKMPRADWKLMATQEVNIPYKNNNPDLYAQRRIAAILSAADKVIEQTRQLISKYKSIKKGMMEDLLEPKEGWKRYEYKDVIVENRLGGNYENSTANTGYPVIKMGNIMRGFISLEKVQYLPFEKKYTVDDVLQKGDLLFNTRNTLDLVGKVSIWNNELPFALYNSNLLRMKFDETIIGSNVFMNYYFNYHKTLMELRGFAIGTTSVAAIYSRDLDKLNIIVPSIPEQRRIAKILSGIDRKIEAEEKVLEKYEKMKKGLMERLLNG